MSLHATVTEQVLGRLGRLSVAARHAVESALSGQHRSVRRGLSVEFAGHRPYQVGDDLRRLDWQSWARTDRFDVRIYEEETRLRATIVVDASGSMAYAASGQRSKFEYARILAAALGFLMVSQSDAVGLALIDTAVRQHLPPTATMGGLLTQLDVLEHATPGGETQLGPVIEGLAQRLSRRGLVILISDCLDDPQSLARALQLLHYRKQDVRVLHLIDRDEQGFEFKGMLEMVGMEREPTLRLDADRIRAAYREALAAHCVALSDVCHASGVLCDLIRTDEDPALALTRVLTHPSEARQ